MENNFKLFKLSSKECVWFVIGLTYRSVLEYMTKIQMEIRTDPCFSDTILIDQLLSTGNGKNRFIQCQISDGTILLSTARNVTPCEQYHEITSKELKEHQEILEMCILTERQKMLIKRGCTI